MANKLNKQGNSVGHDILMAISSVSNCTNVEINKYHFVQLCQKCQTNSVLSGVDPRGGGGGPGARPPLDPRF